MSIAGFKKQLNKANQYVSEKIGGAKGTELDDEFIEMERKTDVMGKLVESLISKTQEFLQPNPAHRAKIDVSVTFQKMRGQAKNNLYPQPEGTLGEHMLKHGQDLGDDSVFGHSLVESGEAFKRLAEVKYSLEENVKQNFLEPLTHLHDKDLREVNHHRKKLSGRRLDFDCKKRKKDKGSAITEDELRVAEEKFEESKTLTETAMHNLFENDVEQIAQLQSFIEAKVEFHRQALDILTDLTDNLETRRNEAANRPKSEHVPKRISSFRRSPSPFDGDAFGNSSPNYSANNYASRDIIHLYEQQFMEQVNKPLSKPRKRKAMKKDPCCEALYDFDPENEGELGFREGDVIKLITQIDENWFEGSVQGVNGFFPINYVKVLTPLP